MAMALTTGGVVFRLLRIGCAKKTLWAHIKMGKVTAHMAQINLDTFERARKNRMFATGIFDNLQGFASGILISGVSMLYYTKKGT